MSFRRNLLTGLFLVLFAVSINAQDKDSAFFLTGTIYSESFEPIAATHVININTYAGDVSDSLGLFRLPAHPGDTLLVRNIAYLDTLVPVARMVTTGMIRIRRVYYPLQEARIFEWGSTYEDFREAITIMPNQQTLGEAMGLPRQDPDYVPYDMNEEQLKSVGFLIRSPISYFYHNFNRKARSSRKVYWSKKNREKHEIFDGIVSPENLSMITGLSGEALLDFVTYLFQRLACDFKCSEFEIYSEVYSHWEVYRLLQQPSFAIVRFRLWTILLSDYTTCSFSLSQKTVRFSL